MVTAEHLAAVAAIERNFASLEVGARATYVETYGVDRVATYVELHDIPYPGVYVSTEGKRLVPPALTMFHAIRLFARFDGPEMGQNGIFVEGKRRFLRPVDVGETISYEAELIDKYFLRGYYYIASRWRGLDAAGVPVIEGLSRNILGYARAERGSGPEPRRELFVLPPRGPGEASGGGAQRLAVEVGRELRGPTLVAHIPPPEAAHDAITRAASLHQHRDDLARRAGFPGGLVLNEFHLSHLLDLLIRYVGLDFLRDGDIDVKFIRPLLDGQSMTPRARVVKAEGARLQLDVWVENQDGEKVAVGLASCRSPVAVDGGAARPKNAGGG